MIDASAFNFDAMKEAVGVDPFAKESNKYGADERFYKLAKDKDGNGAALIRFLPDSEKGMIQKLFKVNTTIVKNGKKRFVSEFSPSSIGQPCPFQEQWQALWNANDKEGAKQFGRGIKYIANIKVVKDPANPANEGKIFLYEMSGAMKDKIQNAVDPAESDRALGAEPKQLFNPLQGNSFRLVAKRGANGQINYDSSEVVNEVNSIYGTVEEALEDIKANTYKLSDLLKPESFMTYEQLQDKMKWVTFSDVEMVTAAPAQVAPLAAEPAPAVAQVAEVQPAAQPTPAPQPAVQPAPAAAAQSNSLDDLLNGLV
jgi:hypothetical protein